MLCRKLSLNLGFIIAIEINFQEIRISGINNFAWGLCADWLLCKVLNIYQSSTNQCGQAEMLRIEKDFLLIRHSLKKIKTPTAIILCRPQSIHRRDIELGFYQLINFLLEKTYWIPGVSIVHLHIVSSKSFQLPRRVWICSTKNYLFAIFLNRF